MAHTYLILYYKDDHKLVLWCVLSIHIWEKNNSRKGKVSAHTQSTSHGKYKSNNKAGQGSWQLVMKQLLQTFCMVKRVWHKFDLCFYLLCCSCHSSVSQFITEIFTTLEYCENKYISDWFLFYFILVVLCI